MPSFEVDMIDEFTPSTLWRDRDKCMYSSFYHCKHFRACVESVSAAEPVCLSYEPDDPDPVLCGQPTQKRLDRDAAILEMAKCEIAEGL